MKSLRPLLLTVAVLSACGRGTPENDSQHAPALGDAAARSEAAHEEDGIKFREGKGLEVSDATSKILKISLARVTEGTLSTSVTRTGAVYRHGVGQDVVPVSAGRKPPVGQASLVVAVSEAEDIAVGTPVTVGREKVPGTVTKVRVLNAGLEADAEVLVEFADAESRYEVGSPVSVTFQGKVSEAAALIPRAALLETVNGTFVYVPNGRYFFRTPVKVGRKTEETVEVLDGLYSGDEVVKEPVTSLWLAELQALRGGVACADGH